MAIDEDRLHQERLEQFERLYRRLEKLMKQYGQPDFLPDRPEGEYCIIYDYWGYPQVKIGIHDLALLRPQVVKRLQETVANFPGWEIVYTVAVRGHYYDWPNMGLYIRAHEIFDTLQRQYFPKEFQGIEYKGSRRGTEAEALRKWAEQGK